MDKQGRVIEPMVANALAGHTLAPLVRFLGEAATSALGPVRGFDWGPLAGLPWRPRLRVGRIILSPAAWQLDPADFLAELAERLLTPEPAGTTIGLLEGSAGLALALATAAADAPPTSGWDSCLLLT